jgi:hypothetical protein
MTKEQNGNQDREECWLELANGGGIMLREPAAAAESDLQSSPWRSQQAAVSIAATKRLTGYSR